MNIFSFGFWRYHITLLSPGIWILACVLMLKDLSLGDDRAGAVLMTLLCFVMVPVSLMLAKLMISTMMVNYHKQMLGTKYQDGHEQPESVS